jgi:hypothetical protein
VEEDEDGGAAIADAAVVVGGGGAGMATGRLRPGMLGPSRSMTGAS